jgi:hypothetical protein
MEAKMRGKKIEAIEKLYQKFGNAPFIWADARAICEDLISPISFKHNGLVKKLGKLHGQNLYQIRDEKLLLLRERKYRIRRKPYSNYQYATDLINKYQGRNEVKCE